MNCIGQTALQLSDQGATIVVADYNEDGAKKLAAEIEAAGGTAGAYKVDVSKGDEIKALIDWTVEQYGTLSGIFNNAGIGLVKPFLEIHCCKAKLLDSELCTCTARLA